MEFNDKDWKLSLPPLPVQRAALAKSRGNKGFGFFMDPGMAKTATTLNEFLMAYDAGVVNFMLVVCPNGLQENWRSEAQKMGFPLNVSIYPDMPGKEGLLIINYEKMINSPFDDIEKFLRQNKTYAVCDESHRVKNPKAKTTKAIVYLFEFATIKRVLTGTPVANNVVDLWSQLRIIGKHGSHRTPYTFRNRYAIMGGFMGKQVIGVQKEDELRSHLEDCSFIAKKEEWMKTLPPKVYSVIGYEMLPNQKKAYERIKKDRFVEFNDKEISATMAITALMKMQEVTSGFMFDDNGELVNFCPTKNPKIDAICDLMDDVIGKAIIFAYYKPTIDLLESRISKSYKTVVIRGGMDRASVSKAFTSFNNDDGVKVLVAQITAAKEGLTLLGSNKFPCYTTIFAENTYSIIDRTQAEDRNHRYGQTSEQVMYYDMVGSPIESDIIKALQEKKSLIEVIRGRGDVEIHK